ncbi:MAG: rhodanese-like domain-containing protein [Clostridiales bacterium]|jgi:rhodanese-related sulfurtransferase|nr:rhodanese-like domain-containing protein [Clostridiales bacterium]
MNIFASVCDIPSGRRLALDPSGALHFSSGEDWTLYDFNAIYKGFEPHCFFTAIACHSGLIYIAGVDDTGLPHIFASLSGQSWERLNLAMQLPGGRSIRASGRIIRILHDPSRDQLFLVCQNGELVTLPDCPKCVKIRQAVSGVVADAWIEGEDIVIRLDDGTEKKISIDDAAQLRVSLSYASQKLLPDGGLIADLRPEASLPEMAGSVWVPFESLNDWLAAQDKNAPLIFVCERGTRSDYAAKLAHKMGFGKAFSLGGMKDLETAL